MSEHIMQVVPDDASALDAPSSGCGCHADVADGEHQHGYITAKDNYQRRLRRIEGQARGLQRMVEEEKYCIDILTQISAMTKALQSVALELLEDHMAHCVVAAAREGGPAAEEKMQEASEAIARLVRS
ncbi:MAG: metal-sensitive transcriptional regulator [Propionibacteriaceae bacterium]|nr:metal-sensitive transcriptional regulator [Propionibacteriaceae bacterium]